MKALFALFALLFSFAATTASAQNTYSAYFDSDHGASPGCTIALPGGTFTSADWRVQATVTTGASPQVTNVTLTHCAAGSFGSGASVGGGYPVGLNNGVGGSDTIEFSAPNSGLLPAQGQAAQLGFTAQSAGGSDVLFTRNGAAGGGPILFGVPVSVPTLGFGALALLALLVAVIARRYGRGRWYSRALALSLVAVCGMAIAATFASDGQVNDWAGISPIATDPTGDPTNGSPDIDLRAAFIAVDHGQVYLRLDVVDLQTQAPAITSANSTNFIVGAPGTFTATATGVPTPGLALSGCALPAGVSFTDNSNGTATLAGTPPAGSAGTYNCTITASNGVPPNAVQGFTLTISNAPSNTTLASNTNPSVFGQSVTFTATVTPAPPASGTPTGTVTFFDGATNIGTGTLNGAGQATFATTALTVGTHSITAQYGGDVNFGPSTSTAVSQVVNKAASTTALVSSVNPSVFGQNVTFTATVALTAPGAGTATGTVTFKDGATTLGTGALAGGVATFSTSTLSVGTHPITAVYAGDTNVQGSTSSAVSQVVNQAATTTVLTSGTNPSVFGQSVTFTATVTASAPSTGTPGGTVTFKDGAATLGTGTLNAGGVATFSTATLAIGPHTLTAVYGGDVNDAGSTSAPLTQTVNQGATTTTIVAAPNPSIFNQSVTFTATVAATAPAAGTPTGTVTFMDGFTTLGTGALNGSGVATFSTSTLSLGTHPITAVYGGDTNFAGSASAPLSQVVNQAGSATALVSATNPSLFGQSVTFTATVTAAPPASGTPTGTVTFFDGATNLGTGTLNGSGVATFSTTSLAVGTHSITAQYGGDANFGTSTSTPVSQVVNQAASSTTVTSGTNPSVFGQAVTFTATVSVTAPGAGTATGTVTFKDGATTLGTGPLAGGVATFSTSTLSVGAHSITAVYGGDTNVTASTSSALSQTVNKTATTTTVVGAPNPSVFGQAVTFTATVTATAPGGGTPTGTATFFDGVTNLGTGALSAGGLATLTTSALTVGAHQVTAQYGGDTNDNGSTSAILTQTVNQGATTTTLTAAPNPSVINQSVTFTATVTATAPAAGTPTGTVTFFDGFTNLGNGPLVAGVATFSTSALTLGTHSITAVYGADTNFAASTSAPLSQVVSQGASTTAIASNTNPSLFGASVTFTATVTAVAPASGTPTGTVTFFDGATNIGTGALNGSGVATLATTTLSAGNHSITATYGGDANFSGSTSPPLTQTVNQAPAITSANIATFSIGSANTFTVTTTGFPTGAAMVISETGALPGGVTFTNNNNGTATLAGTPTAGSGGTYVLTITANNGIAPNATQTFTLTVNQAPTITSANATTFAVGTAGTFTVTTTGLPTGPSMNISETGALPTGVTFVNNNNGTATLAGTPAAGTGGTYALTITANNGVAPNATQSFTLTVNQAPAITSANNTTFKVGTAGTFTVTTSGFPTGASMAISETGALPGGVTFTNNNNGTATLAGTPTANGTFSLTITANNGVAPNATQSFTLTVNEAPTITSANNATFQVGVAGTFTVTTTGFPTNASMVISETGALPGGVTFVNNNNGTATLAGTPSAATGGSYGLTITANNGVAPNATQAFTLTVQQAPVITSANSTTFVVGTVSTFSVTTTGFPTNASMAISESGALPSGVTFVNNNNGTATLAGTPAALTQNASPYALTITANNGVAPAANQAFTLNVTCPVITVSGTIADQTYNTAMATATFTQSGGNGAITWSATGLAPGESIGAGTGQVTGTPTNTGTFPTTVTATDAFGCSGSKAVTYNVNPGASNDAYNALGNVIVNSASVPFAVTDNDAFPAGTTISAFNAVSTGGGTVTMTTSGATIGQFTYNPPVGANSGTDTFTYTLLSNGRTATATVTFTIAGRIWFINDNAGACASTCDGRLTNPFTNTSTFQTANTGAPSNPAANDPVFIYGGGAAYSGSITLLNGQRLIGQGAATALTTLASVTAQPGQTLPATAGATPTLTSAAVVLTTGTGNFVHGLTLGNGTTALSGTNFGTLTINDNVTINTNGQAMNLNTGTLTATLLGVTSTGGTNNINLVSVAGTSNFGSGALSGASNTSFAMGTAAVSSGGTATITYGGTITQATSNQAPIVFQNRSGGTVTLSGNVTATAAGVRGISLLTNPAATTAFTGVLNLSTGTNTGFTATGGGTVSATNVGSTLTTTTGTALNVANTTIAAAGLKFLSISANGAANGIVLNSTGAGGLTVTGDGGGSNNASGGTIQNTSGDGILLTNVSNVSLGYMNVTNPGLTGIKVIPIGWTLSPANTSTSNGVTNFTLNRCNLSDNAGAVASDDGLTLANASGAVVITNNSINLSRHQGVTIDNFSVNMASLTMTSNTVSNTVGGDGVLMQMRGTSVLTTGTVGGSAGTANSFTSNSSTGFQSNTVDTGNILALAISNNVFTGNNAGADLDLSPTNTNMSVTVQNNTFNNHHTTALNLVAATGVTGGTLSATLRGNLIGTQGVLDSGSAIGTGIRIANGGNNVFLTIDSNVIREVPNGRGIDVEPQAYVPNLTLKAKIVNNQVVRPSGTNQNIGCGANVPCPSASIFVLADSNGAGGFAHACTAISGNTAYDPTSYPVGGEAAFYFARRTSASNTLQLEGTQANVTSQITTTNTVSNLTTAPGVFDENTSGTVTIVAPGTCGAFPP